MCKSICLTVHYSQLSTVFCFVLFFAAPCVIMTEEQHILELHQAEASQPALMNETLTSEQDGISLTSSHFLFLYINRSVLGFSTLSAGLVVHGCELAPFAYCWQ